MLDVFAAVKGLLKADRVSIDDNVFRLHYRVTVVVLAAFSTVTTAKQYVGDPIKCMVDGVPSEVMDYYCWIYSTYTVAQQQTNRTNRPGPAAAYPGVSPHADGHGVKHHRYYQWVCFVLFFQAVCFYAPRFLWKSWEGGRVRALSADLNAAAAVDGDASRRADRMRALARHFSRNPRSHVFYLAQYALCELLNLVNVVAQIVFLDRFLDGEFRTYGADVLRFSDARPESRTDPMARVFPKVTKCLFQNYGPSGTIQRFDGLCVLPLNVVNEKIFMFLWCWFAVVAAVSAVNVVYRLAVVLVPPLRYLLLKCRSHVTRRARVQTVVDKCRVGTWFVLYQLSGNVDPAAFKELLTRLACALDDQEARLVLP